ncbi:MAG: nonstructural protein [Microviridae sp.]|nr:MAG: nonstructural protein [Microviridae sp.]
MTKLLMCLHDIKAELYLNPFCVGTMGIAYRMLADEVGRKGTDSQLAAHPEDYLLVRLGSFDETTGEVIVLKTPEMVCNLRDLVVQVNS